jgi:hypothetical protein
MLKYICLCLICALARTAYGQQPIKGRVLEDKTRVVLVNIKVQNLRNKQTTLSDSKGKFTINAKLNDLLVLTGFAYQVDTFMVTKLNDFEVFMLAQEHVLKDVQVKSMDGPSMAFRDPLFHGQTVAYQTDKNGNPKGGLIFRFWYWKKDEHKRQKLEKMLANERTMDEIDKAFSIKNVAQIVPLQGIELDNFIKLYKPSPAQYQSNSFSMTDHVNTAYKKFMKLSAEKRQALPDTLIKDN